MIHAILAASIVAASVSILAAEPPEYQPVPAKLSHARDGLGNVFAKLNAGEDVKIAYFGGSITAAGGWRVQTLKWLQQTYPDAKVSEINAAIGGTGSNLGVFRFGQDVLKHKPDLIFVEFSVNDGGAPPDRIWQAMDGIVRQAWRADPTIDICYVYTFRVGYEKDLDQGLCPRAAGADEMLAEYYGIPSINMALHTAEMAREGKLVFTPPKDAEGNAAPTPEGVMLFSRDGVHPLTEAHQMYTDIIAAALKQMEPDATPGAHTLKAPFVEDNWEKAKMVPLEPEMLSSGWRKLSPDEGLGKRFNHFMPELWEATEPGEEIAFKFKGTYASLYDLVGPDGGQLVATIDGETAGPRPRFDKYCTYHRIATFGIRSGLEDAVHEVSVRIHPEQPDRSSVVDREKTKPNFDPAKYDGTRVRVAALMLIGDVVRD